MKTTKQVDISNPNARENAVRTDRRLVDVVLRLIDIANSKAFFQELRRDRSRLGRSSTYWVSFLLRSDLLTSVRTDKVLPSLPGQMQRGDTQIIVTIVPSR
jgi:hypothetical protein